MGVRVIEEPVGRLVEQSLVDRMLDSALQQAAALVIEGDPGIGSGVPGALHDSCVGHQKQYEILGNEVTRP